MGSLAQPHLARGGSVWLGHGWGAVGAEAELRCWAWCLNTGRVRATIGGSESPHRGLRRIRHLPTACFPSLLSRAAQLFDPVLPELRPYGMFVPCFHQGHGRCGSRPFPSRRCRGAAHPTAAAVAAPQPGRIIWLLAGICGPWRGAEEDLGCVVPPCPSSPVPGGATSLAGRAAGHVPGLHPGPEPVAEYGSTSPVLAPQWGWQPPPWVLSLAAGTHARHLPPGVPAGTRHVLACSGALGEGSPSASAGELRAELQAGGHTGWPGACEGEGRLQELTPVQTWGNLFGVFPLGAGASGRRGLWPRGRTDAVGELHGDSVPVKPALTQHCCAAAAAAFLRQVGRGVQAAAGFPLR